MTSKIINQCAGTPQAFKFPAILQTRNGNITVLATSRSGGIVIHVKEGEDLPFGYQYQECSVPWDRTDWVLLTTPMTITFTP